MISNTNISEVDEDWGNKLWDAIKQTQDKTKSKKGKPPLDETDFDQKTLELEMRSKYGDVGSKKSQESKAATLKTLPPYMGEYKAKSDIKKLPSVKLPSPPKLDVTNLAALMPAPSSARFHCLMCLN